MKTAFAVLLLFSIVPLQRIFGQIITDNIAYVDPAHERQVLDIYRPDGAKDLPVVFWIHGGGWQAGDKTDVQIKPRILTDRGFVFVSTNYRLLPNVEMDILIRLIQENDEEFPEHIEKFRDLSVFAYENGYFPEEH